ncbi:MAG: M50 family metallopeptidase [Rickettsiales bacterium]|jgi:regulator of sigma E protease|nr:M50 family metallopeptidase [Rickettsiales bacterium]
MSLVAFIILLPLVVFVHELGHFVLARANGVRVDAFSIGFGPVLFKWRDRRGTEWRVSLVPLGGYVKMFGQNDVPESAEKKAALIKKLKPAERKVHFEFKTRLRRASIIAAGPAANYLFAFLVFAALFVSVGIPRTPAVVGQALPDSPALAAGIRAGDVILEIAGSRIEKPRDIPRVMGASDGSPLDVVVRRDGCDMAFELSPKSENGRYVLGISYSMILEDYQRRSFAGALASALAEIWSITRDTTVSLGEMIAGRRSSRDLGGLISIAQVSGRALEGGAYSFLYLVAFISVSLGLFNLFPIPMLDGGYLLMYGIEALLRRPLADKFKERMFMAGFAVVVALLLLSNFNDIARLLGR